MKIQMPRSGTFEVSVYIDSTQPTGFGGLDFTICCDGKNVITKRLCPMQQIPGYFLHKRTVVEMSECSCPCYASFIVCAKNGMDIRQGKIAITRL